MFFTTFGKPPGPHIRNILNPAKGHETTIAPHATPGKVLRDLDKSIMVVTDDLSHATHDPVEHDTRCTPFPDFTNDLTRRTVECENKSVNLSALFVRKRTEILIISFNQNISAGRKKPFPQPLEQGIEIIEKLRPMMNWLG